MRALMKIAIVAAILLVASLPASADTTCSAGSICTVTLTQTNTNQLAGVVVTVTIDNSGTNTVLSFQVTTNPITNPVNGIDQVGWNGVVVGHGANAVGDANYASSSSSNFGGNSADYTTGSLDGFGQFSVQGNDPAGTGGFSTAITFTLNGLVETFAANSAGNEFAVHVRYQNNCSGFIGGQTGSGSPDTDSPGCLTTTVVPEPASLALFGTGLVGLAAVVRRRLRR